jgi:hypothetical protein
VSTQTQTVKVSFEARITGLERLILEHIAESGPTSHLSYTDAHYEDGHSNGTWHRVATKFTNLTERGLLCGNQTASLTKLGEMVLAALWAQEEGA